MNPDTLAFIALGLAAVPGMLFLVNMRAYIPLPHATTPPAPDEPTPLSVLIPARNEERNLEATLRAVLENPGSHLEVVVLDDHSTDGTAGIVERMATEDPRLRLESSPPLPPGWCGKQHACHILAARARHDLLVFLDADVRLGPDALARMAAFLRTSGAALASGVPRQELVTPSEKLLLPLIHFILLGFLPLGAMRRTRIPALSAGCGQLFITHREAYVVAGGHSGIRSSLHDGIQLPRLFRRAGFATDLFDATDIACCRMYRTGKEVWSGLSKNATEGLGSPGTILPMSLLLLGGQVMPLGLLAASAAPSPAGVAALAAAVALGLIPRLVAVIRFRQPFSSALAHPLGITALMAIQWWALARARSGRPATWKGRAYGQLPPPKETPRSHVAVAKS